MQTYRKMIQIVILILCCLVNLNIFAGQVSSEPELLIRPCIDDQTFAVVHVDIERLNPDILIEKVLGIVNTSLDPEIAKNIQNDLQNFQMLAGTQLNDLLKAGGKDLFVVFSMYDFPYPFLAVPVDSSGDQDQEIQLYQYISNVVEEISEEDFKLHFTGGLILVGPQQVITRPRTVSTVQIETLTAGFESCAGSAVKVVLFPTSDQLRIITEMSPKIPSEYGTLDFAALAEDLVWAALGINTVPSISLNMTIQSPDAEGANRMLTFVENPYALIEQIIDAQEVMSELEQLLQRLTPQIQNERLLLQIDSATVDLMIEDFIIPSILRANRLSTRLVCATNLKAIGMALIMYADSFDDQFPPDLSLESFQRYIGESADRILVCPVTKLKDSYIYRGATLTSKAHPQMILVYDKKGNHEDGRNVLFLDGHVQFVTEEHFQELVEADDEYRRENELPEIPIQD